MLSRKVPKARDDIARPDILRLGERREHLIKRVGGEGRGFRGRKKAAEPGAARNRRLHAPEPPSGTCLADRPFLTAATAATATATDKTVPTRLVDRDRMGQRT
jgi:hypothetical protein